MITVTFTCGHVQTVRDTVKDPPICVTCGERQVRAVKAPKPKFAFLEPAPVSLKES